MQHHFNFSSISSIFYVLFSRQSLRNSLQKSRFIIARQNRQIPSLDVVYLISAFSFLRQLFLIGPLLFLSSPPEDFLLCVSEWTEDSRGRLGALPILSPLLDSVNQDSHHDDRSHQVAHFVTSTTDLYSPLPQVVLLSLSWSCSSTYWYRCRLQSAGLLF